MVKNRPTNAGDAGDIGSISGLGRSPGGGNGNHSSIWKSHGQSSLVGSSPLGCKELDMTEHTCTCKGEVARYWEVTSVSFIVGNVK